MKLKDFVECFVFTCLGSYAFLAVVNYKLHPVHNFRSCCNQPCYFTRSFGTEGLAATTPANLNLDCSKYKGWVFPCYKYVPLRIFVAVENGRDFSVTSWTKSNRWKNFWGKCVQVSAGMMGWWQKASDWPNPAGVNQTICETISVREKIDDQLNTGYTISIYKVGIAGWTVMKILHDFALLLDVPERITLWFGMSSWIFQLVATCAAFSWGAAAAEVFVSRVSEEQNHACFYQLKPIETLTALGTPLVLLSLTHFKLKNLMLSVVNGDFLYYKSYDVPYRVVKGAAAENPLMTTGLRGDPGFPALPYQQLTFRDMDQLAKFTRLLHSFYNVILVLFICPFGFGNFFLRMTEVAVSHDFSWHLFGFIKVATLAAAGTLLIFPAVIAVLVFRKLSKSAETMETICFQCFLICIFLSSSTSVGAWEVIQAVIWQEASGGAEQRYDWYCCGISAGCFGLIALNIYDFWPPLGLVNSYTFWDGEEEWKRMVQTQKRGEVDSARETLLDGSDGFTSHVEQVLEMFSSQPEKVKHLRPDTEERHAKLETSDDDSSSGTDGVTACWKMDQMNHDSP